MSDYLYEQSIKHNAQVENGNNYWIKFKLEDRSYLYIDIERYLDKGD